MTNIFFNGQFFKNKSASIGIFRIYFDSKVINDSAPYPRNYLQIPFPLAIT